MEHLDDLEKNDFCDFDKPRKHAYQKVKVESNKQNMEASRNKFTEKGGMSDRFKSFRKVDCSVNRSRA